MNVVRERSAVCASLGPAGDQRGAAGGLHALQRYGDTVYLEGAAAFGDWEHPLHLGQDTECPTPAIGCPLKLVCPKPSSTVPPWSVLSPLRIISGTVSSSRGVSVAGLSADHLDGWGIRCACAGGLASSCGQQRARQGEPSEQLLREGVVALVGRDAVAHPAVAGGEADVH